MAKQLSDTQRKALAAAREHGTLEYYLGGFWSAPGAPLNQYGAPEWGFPTRTIEALVRAGHLRVTRNARTKDGMHVCMVAVGLPE
jgi:hypothetical protein